MFISGLWLKDFRGYEDRVFKFSKPVTVIVGPNAAGKTSILEAIFLASLGESFRASKIEEMIRFGAELGRVQLKLEVEAEVSEAEDKTEMEEAQETAEIVDEKDLPEEVTIEVMVNTGLVQGKQTQKRLFVVNGVRRRRQSVVGQSLVVVFRPEDLRLIEGSPSRRRTYLDQPLTLLNPKYAFALKQYEQVLRRRNKLLEQIRERQAPLSTLAYWDNLLLSHGSYVQEQRRDFLESFAQVEFPRNFQVNYLPSIISAKRLAEYQDRSIASGHSLIGPHKDDFEIFLNNNSAENSNSSESTAEKFSARSQSKTSAESSAKPSTNPSNSDFFNIASYGSRGQQRLAVLWLKVCERSFLRQKKGLIPILLLDDIFSELDLEAQAIVFSQMRLGQTIITSADQRIVKLLETDLASKFQLIEF